MIRNFLKRIREIRMANEDAKEGRKLVGLDRYNNRYYQYFDEEGNETRRMKMPAKKYAEDEVDLYWDSWLKHRIQQAPLPEQLKELYEEEEHFREAAYTYEKRDAEIMAKFRKEQEERTKRETPQTSQTQGYGESFEPGKWNPGSKKK